MDMKGMDMKGMDMRGMDMKGMDMKGMDMKGMDMKGMDMKGMDMKGIRGTDPPVHDMETMPKPDAVAPSAESPAGRDKTQIDNAGSAAKQVACDRLKSADTNDPLMQALAQKCREQPPSANPNSEEHTNFRSSTSNSTAPDASSADGAQQPSISEHTH